MVNEYEYDIKIQYRYNNNLIDIDNNNFKSLVIDSDYENKNSPITILSLLLDKNIRDIIISNKNTGTFYICLYKYIKSSTNPIKEKYLEEDFIYFLSESLNTTSELDYNEGSANVKTDIYEKLVVGLVKQSVINNNKSNIINSIFKNCRVIDIIVKYSNNMNLLVEPMNSDIISEQAIPPMTTYSDFIKYLDNNINLYKDSFYRLFFDFNRTYILSGKGIATYAKGELKYPIVLNIKNNFNNESKEQGMEIDGVNKRYFITIDEIDTELQRDTSTNFISNKIVAIDSKGNKQDVSLGSDRGELTNKLSIQRTDNLNNPKSLQSSIKNKQYIVNLLKTNLDNSVFTINRRFMINHYKEKAYDGDYLLLRKREIYTRETTNVILSATVLTLSKVMS